MRRQSHVAQIERLESRTLPTTVTLVSSPNPSNLGENVTLTATVISDKPMETPAGEVVFVERTIGPRIFLGTDAGTDAQAVAKLNSAGVAEGTIQPFESTFTGGIRVAAGDVNGDGSAEIILAPGPGRAPELRIFDGASGANRGSYLAFDASFTGGVHVAAGDVNGDGFDDVIAAAGSGSSQVKVFSGVNGALLQNFVAYPAFTGGVHVAAGDVNGDGRADIITGTGAGGAPNVKVFDGSTGSEIASFFAYSTTFRGGVFVAAGDVNGDGRADIVTGAGAGGGPHVKVFRGGDLTELASFFAYSPSFIGGVRVATADLNGDGRADIFTTPGPSGGAHLKAFDGATGATLLSQVSFPPDVRGAFVAAVVTAIDRPLGGPVTLTGGIASQSTSTLTVGDHALVAIYGGSPSDTGAVSPPVIQTVTASQDFGDAPASYGTLLADDGPRHQLSGPVLGANRDSEANGQPTSAANGDDDTSGDDEDGVTFLTTLIRSNTSATMGTALVTASEPGFLDAFIDFNRDGTFDVTERLTDGGTPGSTPVVAGDNLITFQIPAGPRSVAGETVARFRLSVTGGLGPTGPAPTGEVEDHRVTISDASDAGGKISPTIVLPDLTGGSGTFEIIVTDGAAFGADGPSIAFGADGPSFEFGADGPSFDPMFVAPLNMLGQLRIMGTAGDDTLVLNLSQGGSLPAGGLLFDGGTQATAKGDSLEIIGGPDRISHLDFEYTDTKDGRIRLDGSVVEFRDLEPVVIDVAIDEMFISLTTFGEGVRAELRALTNLAGNVFTTLAGQRRVGMALIPFEAVEFRNPSRSLELLLSNANDEFFIGPLTSGFVDTPITINGLDGPDVIDASFNRDRSRGVTLDGGSGNDSLVGTQASDLLIDELIALVGDDTLDGGGGNDTLSGGGQNDLLRGGVGADSLLGGDGGDELQGGDQADVLLGEAGDDLLLGGLGDDMLSGGDNDDLLLGSEGNDVLDAGNGDDSVLGDDGNDTLTGSGGSDTLKGGTGTDQVTGGTGIDTLEGGTGNDQLDGGSEADFLAGDEGDDVLDGGAGTDVAVGGAGNDTLTGADGDDVVRGESGNDQLTGGAGADLLEGNEGHDSLDAGAGNDALFGDDGDDLLNGGDGADSIEGGTGADKATGGFGADTIRGGSGNDELLGGNDADQMHGDSGFDLLNGESGDDSLTGGGEDDTLSGDIGADTLSGDDGNDRLLGGANDDSALGGDGRDTLEGSIGNDTLSGGDDEDLAQGGDGNDTLRGDDGRDTLNGGRGNDDLSGGDDNDALNGNEGDDLLFGSDDDDSLQGGAGNDELFGGSGDDQLFGNAGNDQLDGGEDDNTLNGGTGTDRVRATGDVHMLLTSTALTGVGNDRLRSIESARLQASGSGQMLDARTFNGSVTLRGGEGNDTLFGGARADLIIGFGGNDSIVAGAGNDVISGGSGLDRIDGGTGSDAIDGGDDNDNLIGGAGNDTILGGNGNDSILGGAENDSILGEAGADSINGEGGTDRLAGGGNGIAQDPLDRFVSPATGEVINTLTFDFDVVLAGLDI